jgi:hypothetical protein
MVDGPANDGHTQQLGSHHCEQWRVKLPFRILDYDDFTTFQCTDAK